MDKSRRRLNGKDGGDDADLVPGYQTIHMYEHVVHPDLQMAWHHHAMGPLRGQGRRGSHQIDRQTSSLFRPRPPSDL